MGWDISYHPISEDQIKNWYFDVLDTPGLVDQLAKNHEIEDFYKDKYEETIQVALKTETGALFETSHGYYAAVVQGFFQKFFYIRGGALSFSETGILEDYFKAWQDFIPKEKLGGEVKNAIATNYSSGVFVPMEKVVALLQDYEEKSEVREELNKLFSHGRIKVFLKALNFAKDRKLGLLEATEVIEPNPLDLNESSCYSNLFNCDPEGAKLYQQAAREQFAEIEKEKGLEPGSIASKATYEVTNHPPVDKKEKKSFWKRLFGK